MLKCLFLNLCSGMPGNWGYPGRPGGMLGHFSCKVSYNQDDVSNFSGVHSGHVDIFVHDILQAEPLLDAISEGTSMKSFLWAQTIRSHVEVFGEGLIDEGLVLSI